MGAPWRACLHAFLRARARARAFLCSRGDASVYFWNARAALAGPSCPEIDAVDGDVELVQRVATGKKPLATIVLSGKSQADAAVLDALLRSSGLPFWPFVNKHGVSMVALAADKRVADLVNVVNMERLYRQLGFPEIADDVLACSSLKLIDLLEGGDLELERQQRFWLLGLAYG
jgi:hypothetical protein